jgi:hypothetical protein
MAEWIFKSSITYAEINREFLATFWFAHTKERKSKRGKVIPAKFDVKFVMQQNRYVMSLDEFFKAINLPNVGSWEEIPSDSDEEHRAFWRRICVDAPNDFRRSKLSLIFSIQG